MSVVFIGGSVFEYRSRDPLDSLVGAAHNSRSGRESTLEKAAADGAASRFQRKLKEFVARYTPEITALEH